MDYLNKLRIAFHLLYPLAFKFLIFANFEQLTFNFVYLIYNFRHPASDCFSFPNSTGLFPASTSIMPWFLSPPPTLLPPSLIYFTAHVINSWTAFCSSFNFCNCACKLFYSAFISSSLFFFCLLLCICFFHCSYCSLLLHSVLKIQMM